MTDSKELMEAALDSLPEGIALASTEGLLTFWNRAAEAITGHMRSEFVGRPVRAALETLIVGGTRRWVNQTDAEALPGRRSMIQMRHRLGHEVPTIVKILVLRDGLGGRIGTAATFHPAESLDALPHGEGGEDAGVEESQAEIEERLQSEFDDFCQGGTPFGVLWITVDQGSDLRKSHGARACEAMLERMERTLANGLRATEKIARWGKDEFLVLSHERSAETLASHAQALAGLARTTEFRWWGDRISLTVSIGAAQAERSEPLAQLLERAQSARNKSVHAGGNHITLAAGRQACSRS